MNINNLTGYFFYFLLSENLMKHIEKQESQILTNTSLINPIMLKTLAKTEPQLSAMTHPFPQLATP